MKVRLVQTNVEVLASAVGELVDVNVPKYVVHACLQEEASSMFRKFGS
jgi:hypothetical protein